MTEYARLVVAVDSTQVTRAEAVMGQFERTATSLERRTDSLASAFSRLKGPLAAVTAGLSVKGIIDTADNYGQMADRIKMATGSAEEFNQVQARLLQSANSTYRPLVEAQELFIQTADTLRTLGNETSDVLDITDSFSYLLVTNAASADRAKNAIDAYSKSIQKGKIDADAWASILAAMPTLVGTIAKETGKSEAEIRSLGVSGKLSLNDLNEGLRRSVDANKALADGMGTTLNDAIVRAQNNLSAYLGQSDKVTSASRLLSGALDLVSDNLDTVASIAGGVAVAAAARYGVKMTQNAIASAAAAQAARQQAAEELRLAQAHHATTAAALAHARANHTLMGATGQLTAATVAHEAAQRRLAAAQAASAGIGRAMLGIMGGPVGLAVTAGAVALSFVDWGHSAEEAARKSIALRTETELLTRAVKELDVAQARQVLQRMEEPYKDAQEEARKYRAQIEYLKVQLRDLPGSEMVEKWRRDLVEAEGNLSTVNQAIEEQEKKMRELTQRINENTESRKRNNDAAEETDLVGQKWLASLKRQADFAGELTETQKVMISIEKGYAGTLSETDRQAALTYAGIIDRANEAARATKGAGGAADALGDRYRSLAESLHRQIALYGETGEVARIRYEVEHGELQKLEPARAKHLESLAAELDMKRQIQEAERAGEQYRQTMREIAMGTMSNPELDRLTETYVRRKEIIDRALETEYLTQQEHAAAMVLLDQETAAARVRVLHEQQQAQEQAALQTMSSIVTITQSQIQQMQGLVEQGGAIGKAFFVMTQTLAAANSIVHGFQSAMAIRAAYAQMAAMSGLKAMGVLAAGEVHANAAQAMGFATAGMIAAQTIQSFDGGGYTGNGPRSGGLDGKGGFMAMVHPRETIIDHTKQKGGGGGAAPVINIQTSVTVESGGGSSEEDGRRLGQQVASMTEALIMSRLEKESRPGGLLWNLYGGGR